MAAAPKTDLHLEIAHVLFIDIVGYSKLLVDEHYELHRPLRRCRGQRRDHRAARSADFA